MEKVMVISGTTIMNLSYVDLIKIIPTVLFFIFFSSQPNILFLLSTKIRLIIFDYFRLWFNDIVSVP